jgi:carbon storage regulator
MLVLGRKENETIHIGDDIKLTITKTRDKYGQVKVGIDAPSHVKILRGELYEKERKV